MISFFSSDFVPIIWVLKKFISGIQWIYCNSVILSRKKEGWEFETKFQNIRKLIEQESESLDMIKKKKKMKLLNFTKMHRLAVEISERAIQSKCVVVHVWEGFWKLQSHIYSYSWL